MEDLERRLRAQAKKSTWLDDNDFNPCEMSGGNYDDAYYAGLRDGETNLARDILSDFFSTNEDAGNESGT